MKRLAIAALVVLGVAAAAFGWWRFGTRYVPAGQPALATLDRASLDAFRDEFNRASTATRLIVLLSPT